MEKARNADSLSSKASGSRRINRPAIRAAFDRFLAYREGSTALPTPEEVAAYLRTQIADRGTKPAEADFAYLQEAAAEVWGAAETSFLARVLRDARVTDKPMPKSRWEEAERAIGRLQKPWQPAMKELLERSRNVASGTTGVVWSAARTTAVCEALGRWYGYCEARGEDPLPNGARLEAYARALLGSGVSHNSVGDYLERILKGYEVITGQPAAVAAQFVLAEFRSKKSAPVTKTAEQIVGASAIFELGARVFEAACDRPTRSATVAREARDGILLMFASAFGERATAVSALEFDATVELAVRPEIRVRLPGRVLKLPERRKASSVRSEIFKNEPLYDALKIYQAEFLPILGQGRGLFPSLKSLEGPLTSNSLGRIVGNLTEHHFGVRVSLHRIRDNIATETSESAENGLMIASGVLKHESALTTQEYYVRSQGRSAMRTFADFTARFRPEGGRARL